ncbi:1,4-alpha-glucan branching protein domain-containing protein [Alicyclobacillus suci]|uniref:1,4-alpha-glucan branching protein domain-containing protein n=1 Tax=Alicyclobacillus suci TaxID=2816080 RepID=UPI001A907CF0|nr:1,4-alpha-glucan branching protein domain-containing protein [Alicyclobacillus suci]
MTLGYLNLVLHAHLPYVRHPEEENRIEERWLFEALTETYIPLLQVFHTLAAEGVDFRVTLSLSPPLISMLADEALQQRYRQHMTKLLQLCDKECERTAENPILQGLAKGYRERFEQVLAFFDAHAGNILPAFAALQRAGHVELVTSAATHAFLPYVLTEEAIRAQIATAVDVFVQHLGTRPRGMWLPECAYDARVDRILLDCGVQYVFIDTHGLTSATPAPIFGTYAPVVTPTGLFAFARDTSSSHQVWSSEYGYPGDYDYREYYRDIGFQLSADELAPLFREDGIRLNTGIKYDRITGQTEHKQPYDFVAARAKAAMHAEDFLRNRTSQIARAKEKIGRAPVVTAPYDMELFGHWWYEGPVFLDMLFRKMHFDQTDIQSITPSEYLALYSDFQTTTLHFSTWGRDGYGDVWLNGTNDWIYPALHECELTLSRLANANPNPSLSVRRALNQAVREWMLAASSDFAFMMDNKTTVDYAIERTKRHVNRCRRLCEMVDKADMDVAYLEQVERDSPIFPNVDYRIFCSRGNRFAVSGDERTAKPARRILLLSWEFPPMTVGGLARHVYDLSRHLVQQGYEVHVVTTEVNGYPNDELVVGVHVHRVHVPQPDGGAFIHFAFQLNLAMLARCRQLIEEDGLQFDVIHAHDWLVADAARFLKVHHGLPLVVTIHATEHGRNQGIQTDTQRHIDQIERELTNDADEVIVCSRYMAREVTRLFGVQENRVHLIPNGVDATLLRHSSEDGADAQGMGGWDVFSTKSELRGGRSSDRPMVLFVGRLVREKGVHVLLEAATTIVSRAPHVRFVIVGHGPMLEDLRAQAQRLGLAHCVEFLGFVGDDTRNALLEQANVAVFPSLYEPFGIVALEAMAAGVPVVVSDVGGLSDIVSHEHNGLTAFPGDAASVANQVWRLLREPQFAAQLADNAKRSLHRFDWQNIARQTAGVYHRVSVLAKADTVTSP